jgi:hypothetical protein
VDAFRSRDDERLTENLGGEAAPSIPRSNAITDVPTFVGQEVIELVADRDATYKGAAIVGDQKRGRHTVSRQVNAALILRQPLQICRPRLGGVPVQQEAEAFLGKLSVGGSCLALIFQLKGAEP